jgi:hypothetical protein
LELGIWFFTGGWSLGFGSSLEVGVWDLVLHWSLELGIWCFTPFVPFSDPRPDFIFGRHEMVALTNRTVQLVLFGAPTKDYRVQTAPSITGPLNWQPGPAVAMTNSFRLLPWQTTSQSILFFRVQQE